MNNEKFLILKDIFECGFKLIELYGINPQGFCTCYKGAGCQSAGKHPVHFDWKNHYITTVQELESIINKKPYANFGIITGDGLVVIDVDKKSGGLESMEQIKDLINPTMTVQTGGGGYHFYYKTDRPVRNRTNVLAGIDVRGDGGFVVAPTSKHKSGGYYTIIQKGNEDEHIDY